MADDPLMAETTDGKQPKKPPANMVGAGMVIGVGAGVALGAALDNIAVGVPVGAGVGLALGVALSAKSRHRR
jgi:hypothetical protein